MKVFCPVKVEMSVQGPPLSKNWVRKQRSCSLCLWMANTLFVLYESFNFSQLILYQALKWRLKDTAYRIFEHQSFLRVYNLKFHVYKMCNLNAYVTFHNYFTSKHLKQAYMHYSEKFVLKWIIWPTSSNRK